MKYFLLPLISAVFSFQLFAFELIFDRAVPNKHQELLIEDIGYLKNVYFREQVTPFTTKIMQDSELSSKKLIDWLAKRVRYIVPANNNLKVKKSYTAFEFPNPNQLPKAYRLDEASRALDIYMSNLGAELYLKGKAQNQLLSLKIKTGFFKSETIEASTPRIGVLKLGKAMFAQNDHSPRVGDLKAVIHRIDRISTLFHEARHSDGHGEHTGFTHIKCPPGHDYAHRYACDFSLNGAYTVGAYVTKELAHQCETCDEADKEFLKLQYLDSMSRVIKEEKKPALTEKQKKLIKDIDEAMEIVAKKMASPHHENEVARYIEEYQELSAMRSRVKREARLEVIPAQNLDPTPEGQRL